MLAIQQITVQVEGKTIIDQLSLNIPKGQVHVIMGPNGSGKSSLSKLLAGHDAYTCTAGSIQLDQQDLLSLSVEQRTAAGLFLGFQYPMAIEGVSTYLFLREMLKRQAENQGKKPPSPTEMMQQIHQVADSLQLDRSLLKRSMNVGFSGGEKKRLEMLQMLLLSPKLTVLDEIDSGLDIDALNVVAKGIAAFKGPDHSVLLITHYPRLLELVKPDRVHVLKDGQLIKSGDISLARTLEKDGYQFIAS
jgi:Fe-S cluster assembly ATP-binding protein